MAPVSVRQSSPAMPRIFSSFLPPGSTFPVTAMILFRVTSVMNGLTMDSIAANTVGGLYRMARPKRSGNWSWSNDSVFADCFRPGALESLKSRRWMKSKYLPRLGFRLHARSTRQT